MERVIQSKNLAGTDVAEEGSKERSFFNLVYLLRGDLKSSYKLIEKAIPSIKLEKNKEGKYSQKIQLELHSEKIKFMW